MNNHCAMKGFLSFLILWLLNKKSLTGAELGLEIEKRKGHRPSPGTIYPVLKDLKNKSLLKIDTDKRYSLTKKGKQELGNNIQAFLDTFWDVDEMRNHCCYHHGSDNNCSNRESTK